MKDGEIAGAFSVSMPKYRLTEENKTTINQALLATKAAIEAKYSRKERQTKVDWDFVCLSFLKTFAFSFYLYNEVVNFFIINIYF